MITVSIQSSLEVVEVPPPSPEGVEVPPPPPRRGPKMKNWEEAPQPGSEYPCDLKVKVVLF